MSQVRSFCWVAYAWIAISIVGPTGAEDLSVQRALDLAIVNNPSIAAGDLSADAATHAARGARALSNPELVVAPTALGEAGADSAVLFSQPLEINGSRQARSDIATHRAAAARHDANALRRGVALQVRQAYWDLAQAQELVRLNQQNLEHLRAIRDAVQKQLDAGAVPGVQVTKADVELARARQEVAVAELAVSQARAVLNVLMGRPAGAALTASDPLVFEPVSPDRDRLVAAAANRPEIAAARAQVAAARGEIRAAKLRRTPDLAVQARRETFDSGSDSGVAVAITLPLLDWGSAKAARKQAEAEAASREKQFQAVTNQLEGEVERAIARMEASASVVREYEAGILTRSEELAAAARKGYEKGATGYLEVLEAQRTLLSVKTRYTEALAEHARALAQLEWASGVPLSGPEATEVTR